MALQFEFAVNGLKDMHPNYNNSSGLSKQQPDDLSAYQMNRNYVGRSPSLRNTLIVAADGGFLGPFPSMLVIPGKTHEVTKHNLTQDHSGSRYSRGGKPGAVMISCWVCAKYN